MIEIHHYRCVKGCRRSSAAHLDRYRCETHNLPWMRYAEDQDYTLPTASDIGPSTASSLSASVSRARATAAIEILRAGGTPIDVPVAPPLPPQFPE